MNKEDERDSENMRKILEHSQTVKEEDFIIDPDEQIKTHRGTCRWRPPPFPEVDETMWCGRWSNVANAVTLGCKQSCENCYYFRLGVENHD